MVKVAHRKTGSLFSKMRRLTEPLNCKFLPWSFCINHGRPYGMPLMPVLVMASGGRVCYHGPAGTAALDYFQTHGISVSGGN